MESSAFSGLWAPKPVPWLTTRARLPWDRNLIFGPPRPLLARLINLHKVIISIDYIYPCQRPWSHDIELNSCLTNLLINGLIGKISFN